jgi:hypothetical protein
MLNVVDSDPKVGYKSPRSCDTSEYQEKTLIRRSRPSAHVLFHLAQTDMQPWPLQTIFWLHPIEHR